MNFYLYLFFSLLACLTFVLIIIYFGRAYITGAPFAVSTPLKVKLIISLLEKHSDSENKITVDLGSGDGRLVIALAQAGYQAHGYETNPFLVWLSRRRIKKAGLSGKAFIHKENYWKKDFSQYQIVVVFGVFYMMTKLQEKLKQELKPEALVVSNFFEFPNWQEVDQEKNIYIYKR